MEEYYRRFRSSWSGVTSRTVREAVGVLLMLMVVLGSGFSALSTYANLVVFNEDRFAEQLADIFDDEDVHNLVASSFTASAVEMAELPSVAASSAGAQQTLGAAIPPVVADLLTDGANDALLDRAIRQTHNNILVVEAGTQVVDPPIRSVRVDLSPIFNQMLDEIVADEELAFLGTVNPPAGAGVVEVLERNEGGDRFWEFLGQLQDRRNSTITLIVLFGIASLVISPTRSRLVWAMGTGIVTTAVLLGVGNYGSRALMAVMIDNTDTVRVAQSIHAAMLGDLTGRLVDMAIYGVALILVGLAAGWLWRQFGPPPHEEKAVPR